MRISNWKQRFVFALLSLSLFSTHAQEELPPEQQLVHVGVLAIRGSMDAQIRWQPTLDWLSQRIPGVTFELHPHELRGMVEAVEKEQLDFVLTNPGQAVQLGRKYAFSWLATLTSGAPQNTNYGIGTAFIVKNDSPYHSVQDLFGLPIAAVSQNAFGGFLTMRYELQQMGIDTSRFFADVRFLGFPIDASLYQLRDDVVKASVVPACLLEKMSAEGLLNIDNYRVINQKTHTQFHCQASTQLYPNWSFAKTPTGSETLAKIMTQLLLAMPAESKPLHALGASGWTSPVSFLSVDKLYQALDLHPLQQPWWVDAYRWLGQRQQWAWGLFVLVIVLNGYHFWLEFRFSKSKKQLEQTLFRLKEKSEFLEHTQRLSIVGELGTSVAHEMNQPLAAIRNYCEGVALRVEKQKPSAEVLPLLEKVQKQVDRADAIVQRLRALIKNQPVVKEHCDIDQIVRDSVDLLQNRIRNEKVALSVVSRGKKFDIQGDAVGLQQVIINVLNNSMDACKLFHQQYLASNYEATVEIQVEYSTPKLIVTIFDNGTGLKVERPLEGLVTSKKDGLGLGLTICRDIIEKHQGTLTICSKSPHGCQVTVTLPGLDEAVWKSSTDKDVTSGE